MARPDPSNQFYRLVRGPSGPWVRSTRWGTIWDSANCCAAEGAVSLQVQSDGKIKVGPPTIRANQSDFSGGIGLDDMRDAHLRIARAKGVAIPTLMMPDNVSWADVITFLKERRHVSIQADHGFLPLALRCQDNYTGDHAFGLDEFRTSDSRVLMYDSLCTNPKWVTQSGIRAAAEALALRLRGSRGRLFVGVTKQRAVTLVVTYKHGGVPDGRGSFIVNESGHALRREPSTSPSAIIAGVKMVANQTTFRACQTAKGPKVEGNPDWKGTADGNCWFPEAWLTHRGHYTHRETIR